jgi:fructokinase
MAGVGAIDAGGTSWRCAIIDDDRTILARTKFPTTSPQETLAQATTFFLDQLADGITFHTIGVSCFGPLCIDPASPNWGHILATTKAGWSGADVAGTLSRETGLSVRIDSDVTAAALAEKAWGAGQGAQSVAYVTVGTGIGAGIVVGDMPLWGAMRPEAGHMRVPRHPDDQAFAGVCSFHSDCIEGMASAPAILARWGIDASDLSDDHVAWDIVAHYLAHLAVNLVLTTTVEKVIFGGGVCARAGLVERIAEKAKALIGPYGNAAPGEAGFEIVSAGLGLDAGLLGGAWLAQQSGA